MPTRLRFALLPVILTLAVVQVTEASVTAQITAPRPARVFFPGETPWLNLAVADYTGPFTWTVTDFWGRTAISRQSTISPVNPVILNVPYALPLGVYYLALDFNGSAVYDAFCVIPRPDDDPGDYRQFGVQWGDPQDDAIAGLALAGARYDRVDVAWRTAQTAPGVMSTAQADYYGVPLAKYGMQMIPIFGYTPDFDGIRPLNADHDSRVAAAPHCWEPKTTVNFAWCVAQMGAYLGPKTTTWPPPQVGTPRAGTQKTLPLVARWEIWNEADQAFYYGTWEKYLELLRIATLTLKGQDPRARIVYGGACAHWTELAIACGSNQQYYFDEMAWHGNGNPEQSILDYMNGVPSLIGYRYSMPRETTHTESYFVAPAGTYDGQYLMRTYAVLKAFRQGLHCRAGCTGSIIGNPDPGSAALLWTNNGGQVVPNGTYAAFAAARYWLSDAAYAGPVYLDANANAHLFLKRGRPLLVAWSDTGCRAQIRMAPGTCQIDFMGNATTIGSNGASRSFALTNLPVTLYMVDEGYVAEACQNYVERQLTTRFGLVPDRSNGYVGVLEDETVESAPKLPQQIRDAMAAFGKVPATDWVRQVSCLDAATAVVTSGMQDCVACIKPDGGMTRDTPGVLWRMARLAEWLAEAADGRARRGGMKREASASDVAGVRSRADSLQQALAPSDGSTLKPYSAWIVGRAQTQTDLAEVWGTGSLQVARAWCDLASAIGAFEPTVTTGIFATVALDTADRVVKATLFEPGKTHTINVRVYNFTGAVASGSLHIEFPMAWNPPTADVSFRAGPHSTTSAIPVTVTVPGTPLPWVTVNSDTTAGPIVVSLPAGLADSTELWVRGTLDDGRQLLPLRYRVSVGHYLSTP